MLKILRNALTIAIPFSITAAILVFIFTSLWAAEIDWETQKIYKGFEAVQYKIENEGLSNYVLKHAPGYFFFFATILLVLIIQGATFYRKPNA